jgi:membrane fusion protein (multidrug efflux system)
VVQVVIAAGMLAAAGGAWWYFHFAPSQAEGAAGPAAGAGGMQVPVETVKVRVGPIQRRLIAVGSLRSNESVIIRPEVAGRIAAFHFEEGKQVEAGQPLVVLDDSIYGAELEEVQAALELSQANHERAVDLLKRGAGTTKARDETVAALRANRAELALAEARLAKLTIVVLGRDRAARGLGRRLRQRRPGHGQSRADRPAQGRL